MRKVCLVLMLCLLAPSLFAQSWRDGDRDRDRDRYGRRYRYDNRFELTPFVGYRWGGTLFADSTNLFTHDVQAETAADFGLNFGIPIGYSNMKLELMVNRQNTFLTTGSGIFEPNNRLANFDVTYYHAGLMIPFSESRNATPFFIVSAGIGNLDPQVAGASASNRFSASAGVGVKVPVSNNMGIRIDGRGYFTSLNSNNNNNCGFRCSSNTGHDFYQGEVNLGFVFSF
jgi:hypothetical protein